jgi:predicted Zn-dependent protease
MAVSDHPLERFRVLNGLGEHSTVKAGDLVKVVVE